MSAKDMLGVTVRKLVTLSAPVLRIVCDLLEKLSDPDWVEATKRFLRKKNPWPLAQKAVSNLLTFVGEVKLPAISSFSAKDHFRVGEVEGVKIGYIGDNLKNNFLSGDGKVETDVAEATFRIHKLVKGSVDDLIIAELGGEGMVETTLAQMFEMMKAQGHGEQGILLTNGYANIFYIKDAKGVVWAVRCDWNSDDGFWHVYATSVSDLVTWLADFQVFSRDSGS